MPHTGATVVKEIAQWPAGAVRDSGPHPRGNTLVLTLLVRDRDLVPVELGKGD